GRWFGYRPGYMDLCRLYTTAELVDWYEHITAASEELRNLFDYMKSIGGTPLDFGLRVRSHPDGLLITGALKMRHGIDMELSFDGSISETIVFHRVKEKVKRNFDAVCEFIKKLGQPTGERVWTNVSGQKIIE